MTSGTKRWQFDLKGTSTEVLPKPPGCLPDTSGKELETRNSAAQVAMKEKRAMQVARIPGQSLLMNGFMMYMSGTSINIFSIMITAMVFSTAATSVMNTNKAFASLDDGKVRLAGPKAIYLALSIVGVMMALYKLMSLGLLPVTSADWTSRLPLKLMEQHTGAPIEI